MQDENKYLIQAFHETPEGMSTQELRVYSTDGADLIAHDLGNNRYVVSDDVVIDECDNAYLRRFNMTTWCQTLCRMSLFGGIRAAEEVYSLDEGPRMDCVGITKDQKYLLFKTHALDFVGRTEPFVQFGPVAQVTQLDLRKCAALTGFHVVDFNGRPKATVMFKHVTGAYLVSVDFGHGQNSGKRLEIVSPDLYIRGGAIAI